MFKILYYFGFILWEVVKFYIFDTSYDGSGFFQATTLVFVTSYRSGQVLRSVVHGKTAFCIDFLQLWLDFRYIYFF